MKKEVLIFSKKIAVFFSLITFTVLLSAGGGGGGGGGKGPGGSNGKTPEDPPCGTINCVLQLPLNITVSNISGRDPSVWFQPASNILNGGQVQSTASLNQNITQNYCLITITAIGCTGYGDKGTQTYLWDSSNDGVNNDGKMNIKVPQNSSFSFTIEIHEGCGMWYLSYPLYRRAKFIHSAVYYPISSIVLTDRSFSLAAMPQCN